MLGILMGNIHLNGIKSFKLRKPTLNLGQTSGGSPHVEMRQQKDFAFCLLLFTLPGMFVYPVAADRRRW